MDLSTIGAASPRPVKLPTTAVNALADLVAAGFGIARSLEALPRKSLKAKVVRQLDEELTALRAGGPIDAALERLGLEITAASVRGSKAQGTHLEAALRADVAAQQTATEALAKVRKRVQLFAIVMAGLALSTLYISFVSVPNIIKKSTENLPADWELPAALLLFDRFRNLWLATGGAFLLMGVALSFAYAGLLGRKRWSAFLSDLRLHLPFLRAHAIHSCSARLLEALAYEQTAGIPANETVRRIHQREAVPRLRADLELAASRLDVGDPWESCLRGTLLDTPVLADLTMLAGHGARPTKGFQWAATRSREEAVKGLRRAVGAISAIILIPSFFYLLALLHVASITAAVAQVESVHQQLEQLTDEVEGIIRGKQ